MNDNIKLGLAKARRKQMVENGAEPDALAQIDSDIADLSDSGKAERNALTERRAAHMARFGALDDRYHTEGFVALRERAAQAAALVADEAEPLSAQGKISAGLKAHRQPKPTSKETRLQWDGAFNESTTQIEAGLKERHNEAE